MTAISRRIHSRINEPTIATIIAQSRFVMHRYERYSLQRVSRRPRCFCQASWVPRYSFFFSFHRRVVFRSSFEFQPNSNVTEVFLRSPRMPSAVSWSSLPSPPPARARGAYSLVRRTPVTESRLRVCDQWRRTPSTGWLSTSIPRRSLVNREFTYRGSGTVCPSGASCPKKLECPLRAARRREAEPTRCVRTSFHGPRPRRPTLHIIFGQKNQTRTRFCGSPVSFRRGETGRAIGFNQHSATIVISRRNRSQR